MSFADIISDGCPFYDFQAHAAVVVRAFPESGLVVVSVGGTVCAQAPEPFSVFPVYDMAFDELPASAGFFQRVFPSRKLPQIEITHDGFSLHPPVSVRIYRSRVSVKFVYHPAAGYISL